MTGPEVIETAINALAVLNTRSRDVLMNKVRSAQIVQLRAAVQNLPKANELEKWQQIHRSELVLARAILDDITPGWNRK